MTIKELKDKIAEIQQLNPDKNVDAMEIGPVFSNGLMMAFNLTLEKDAGWDGKDAIGLHWHC